MSAPFSPHPPRAPDAEILKRSLKRPTLATWLFAPIVAGGWWTAYLSYSTSDTGLATAATAYAVVSTYAVYRYLLWRHRLIVGWRSGIRVDVVLKKSLYFWTRAYWYTVELDDGRSASVILSAESKPGTTLPALVDRDLLVVLDFSGHLKAGRLRRTRASRRDRTAIPSAVVVGEPERKRRD